MPLDQPEITGPIQGVDPVELTNFADDPDVVKQIKDEIVPLMKKARDNRDAKLRDDWDRYRDIYNMRRTITFYDGRSKLFLGALRKAVDTLTRVAKDSITADPYVSVETDVERWRDVGVHFMKYLLDVQGNIRPKVSMFLRQLYQIGTSCMKFNWKTRARTVKYRANGEILTRKAYDHYGPELTVVDMKHVYVWPEVAVDYEGLELIFEDSVTTVRELRKQVEKGWYAPDAVDRVIEKNQKSLEQEKRSNSQTVKEGIVSTELEASELDITELWVKFQLPDDDSDEVDMPWVWVTIAGDEVLRVQENPYWFQYPPYLFGAIFREHDYFYGHGLIEAGEMWQYMLNDLVNQTMDCGTYALNPISIMDPMLIDDPDMYQIEPAAKWLIDPEAVRFERPPQQMTTEGLTMVRFLLNIIQDSSDANALIQGAPREGMGKAVSTATGMTQLTGMANAAIVDQVEELEAQVFTRLLHMAEISAHQFMEDEMIIRLEGPDGVIITDRIIEPQDLILSTDVRWIASRRLREKLAKGQQYLNMLNMALGVDPQLTLQQGFMIDLKYLVKGAAVAIGADDSDRIVVDVTQSMPGVPPELEYELVIAGRKVVASPIEPYESHMTKIQALMAMPVPETEFARIKLQELIASHFAAAQQAQQMMLQATGGMQNGAPAAVGAPQGAAPAPGFPVRPQEQPQYGNEGAANQGLLSSTQQ